MSVLDKKGDGGWVKVKDKLAQKISSFSKAKASKFQEKPLETLLDNIKSPIIGDKIRKEIKKKVAPLLNSRHKLD